MTHDLPQTFDQLASGALSKEAFEHRLLMLCKANPELSWEALALLDQYFRRGRIERGFEQSVRRRIQRQALGIESYRPDAIPVADDADTEDRTVETAAVVESQAVTVAAAETVPSLAVQSVKTAAKVRASVRWRPYFRISPAIALTTVVLAGAASPTVREQHDNSLSNQALPGAAADAAGQSGSAAASSAQDDRGPTLLSLSSDRYVADGERGVVEVSVERSPGASGDASFLWWTEASGAKPDLDYIAGTPRRVQMADGISTTTLRIPVLSNPKRRHIEMFYVLIGRPSADAGVGPIHRAAVFLLPPHAH